MPLQPRERGCFEAAVEGVEPGTRPLRFDGGEEQAWRGIALEEYIFYQLHVGTFTPEDTFEAVIPPLDRLAAGAGEARERRAACVEEPRTVG